MHEGKKLEEAKYFYFKMIEEQRHREIFTYNLSAFLSSARSVLQYALNEAKTKSGGQQWYDNCISASCILRFFKDKRDINIHTELIQPQAYYKLEFSETIHLSNSISVTVTDKDENIKEQYCLNKPEPLLEESQAPVVMEIKYKFDNWDGSEDVLRLCQMYIQELENLIEDGVNKGLITG